MSDARVIYLSGPMKGYPESNYPLFRQVAADLRADGHRVYNPAEFPIAGRTRHSRSGRRSPRIARSSA